MSWRMSYRFIGRSFKRIKPPRVAYKRRRSLRDRLVKTHPVHCYQNSATSTWLTTTKLGYFKCTDCTTCRQKLMGLFFIHPHSGQKIVINHSAMGTSKFVIYIVYVGKTGTSLWDKMENHRSAIRAALATGKCHIPVAKHFVELKHSLAWDAGLLT